MKAAEFADGLIMLESESGVHVLVLSRPEKRNALTLEMVDGLLQAFAFARSETARPVVLLGEGMSFCGGADIRLLQADMAIARVFYARYADLLLAIRTYPSIVVAGVHGYAVGGGAELAMEADFRVMSREAIIGYPDVQIGSTPATVQRLVRIIGDAHARRLVLLGEQMPGEEAKDLGLALSLVDTDGQVRAEALSVAERASRLPALSVQLAKEVLELSPLSDFDRELQFNALAMALCHATEDQQNHAAAFLSPKDGGSS